MNAPIAAVRYEPVGCSGSQAPAPELTICTVILVPGCRGCRPELPGETHFGPASGRFTAVAAVVAALAGSAAAAALDRTGPPSSPARCRSLSPSARSSPLRYPAAVPAGCCWPRPPPCAGEALTKAGVHGVVTAPGSVPGAGYLAAIGPGLQAAGMLAAVGLVRFLQQHRPQGPRQPDRLEHRELGRVPREMARVADADIAGHNDG